jgi:hypothetical protein
MAFSTKSAGRVTEPPKRQERFCGSPVPRRRRAQGFSDDQLVVSRWI